MAAPRRRVLQAVPILAAAFAIPAARAATTDLVVCCDPTLARPLRAVAGAFRARAGVIVHIFPTSAGLILPQLERQVQNDIVVTRVERLSRAADAGIVAADAVRGGGWRNRLVIAARRDARPGSLSAVPVAVCDPTPASDIDGAAVLSMAGLRPKSIVGAIDTDEVIDLLASGAAPAGLVHATDLSADARLEVMEKVPDEAYAPIVYGAAVTRLARRPNPDAFVRFLGGDEGTAILRAHGLESGS
jgi:molybdate transport system substrate-binding protein